MIYTGCIFDLDGTLYVKAGFGKRLVLGNMQMYEKIRAMNTLLKPLAGKEFRSGSEYKMYLFEGIAKLLNDAHPDRPPINAVTIGHWYHHDYYPAVIRTLAKYYQTEQICRDTLSLMSRKYLMALYSDTGVIDERLKAIGLHPTLFSYRICADQNGHIRPAPKAYTSIAHQMGIPPKQVLVVGDRPEIDGVTAQEAGMDYFQIGDHDKKDAFLASWKRLSGILLEP
jgi:HAD superfamily hydrolase (TIGR01549 family)